MVTTEPEELRTALPLLLVTALDLGLPVCCRASESASVLFTAADLAAEGL